MAVRVKEKLFRKGGTQEQNLFVLWFGTFMAGIGFSLVMSFTSLYMDTLGNYSTSQLNFWSGLAFSSTLLVTMLTSPWWRKLADQKGGKLMLLCASLGMVIAISLMGCVASVYQLAALRLPRGVFSSYISNTTVFVATGTPKEKGDQVLGALATDSVIGTLFGPLLGGISASALGYRPTFFITGIILFFVSLLSLFFVYEKFIPVKKENMVSVKQILKDLEYPHVVIGMFVTAMTIQTSSNSVSPIISLYIRRLLHEHENATLISGIIAPIPGIATLVAAPRFGHLGDKIGSEKIPAIGLGFATLAYILMSFITNVQQLATLCFLIGISGAYLLPVVQTLITEYSPHRVAGRIFNYNQSFQATGSIAGSMIDSSISSVFGYRGAFPSTSLLVLISFLPVRYNTQEVHQ